MEGRLAVASNRAVAAERAAAEAARSAELASQRLQHVVKDLAHATAEVGDLRGRYDAAISLNGQLQQQLVSLTGDMRQMEGRWAATATAAAGWVEGGRAGQQHQEELNKTLNNVVSELRMELGQLRGQVVRLECEKEVERGVVEGLREVVAGVGVGVGAEVRGRREGDAAVKEEVRSRQVGLLSDMAALAVEVEGYR